MKSHDHSTFNSSGGKKIQNNKIKMTEETHTHSTVTLVPVPSSFFWKVITVMFTETLLGSASAVVCCWCCLCSGSSGSCLLLSLHSLTVKKRHRTSSLTRNFLKFNSPCHKCEEEEALLLLTASVFIENLPTSLPVSCQICSLGYINADACVLRSSASCRKPTDLWTHSSSSSHEFNCNNLHPSPHHSR